MFYCVVGGYVDRSVESPLFEEVILTLAERKVYLLREKAVRKKSINGKMCTNRYLVFVSNKPIVQDIVIQTMSRMKFFFMFTHTDKNV